MEKKHCPFIREHKRIFKIDEKIVCVYIKSVVELNQHLFHSIVFSSKSENCFIFFIPRRRVDNTFFYAKKCANIS